jgi:hypothetical protein
MLLAQWMLFSEIQVTPSVSRAKPRWTTSVQLPPPSVVRKKWSPKALPCGIQALMVETSTRRGFWGSTVTPENARVMPAGVTLVQPPPATSYFHTWPASMGSGWLEWACGPPPLP